METRVGTAEEKEEANPIRPVVIQTKPGTLALRAGRTRVVAQPPRIEMLTANGDEFVLSEGRIDRGGQVLVVQRRFGFEGPAELDLIVF